MQVSPSLAYGDMFVIEAVCCIFHPAINTGFETCMKGERDIKDNAEGKKNRATLLREYNI